MIHTLKLSDPWFDMVKMSVKKYEGRRLLDKTRQISTGDLIIFHSLLDDQPTYTKLVKRVIYFNTFEEALRVLGMDHVLPGVASIEEGIMIYSKFVSFETQLKDGVVMIELEDGIVN